MTALAHKTRAAARKAAHHDLGAKAVEGMDFTLRNTGAGWIAIKIPPATTAAKKAQAKRADIIPEAARRAYAKAERQGSKRPTKRPAKPPQTKTEMLVSMMSAPEGATSKAMEEAASWAPHSVRGLVGMLKKKGVPVESLKDQGSPTRYHIPAAKPAADDIGDVI